MRPVRQRNTLVVILLAIVVALFGAFLTWLGTLDKQWYNAVLTQVGTAVIVTAGLGVLWDSRGRRLLADEIFEHMEVSVDVQRWGLRELTMAWNDQRWATLFARGPNVDILIGYAQTWRGVAASGLETFLANKDARLRVCLPDPESQWLMEALSHRYNTTPDRVKDKIKEAARYFADLRTAGEAVVQIFYRDGEPMYGLYRFESVALLTLYPHKKERSTKIPALLVENGELHTFIREDFESAIRDAREVADAEIYVTP